MSENVELKDASKSIFDPDESAWDHVFEDVGSASKDLLANSGTERKVKRNRPTQMTTREVHAFGEMYKMVFDTTGDKDFTPWETSSMEFPTVGHSVPMSELAIRLRRQSRNVKWTTESDQELDRKKEAMNLCHTDQELLEWAAREVFAESERFEKLARESSWSSKQQLQPSSYPHVIALLMNVFRDKYADPYLALSIFQYARHLSIPSYVFGCTSHAYNELIATRWKCFRDLRGICDALEEMRVNGIELNSRTRILVEMVRREVGERNLWEKETAAGTREVWDLVTRIEWLASMKTHPRHDKQKKRWSSTSQLWKQDNTDDAWKFGIWQNNSVGTACV
ncbi:hypothetical protein BDY19DRAFT_996614 [Irpex rosettiformis]|uniref:Uncharacterized protein n=1 Tax=Irpex rosettiformis TaxID=378272 RepID=A0ACB8TUJ6_9APHY|nr:hypothetical protein BDY19DRAFT_996614 [Irpex rosettiformis]